MWVYHEVQDIGPHHSFYQAAEEEEEEAEVVLQTHFPVRVLKYGHKFFRMRIDKFKTAGIVKMLKIHENGFVTISL